MNLKTRVTLSVLAPVAACLALLVPAANAQIPALAPRLAAPISNASRVTLAGSRPPRAVAAADAGVVPPSLPLHGISLVFSRTPAQQAALDALLVAQQNPASPLYRHWLTPDQFAARFGVADADIAAVENWLQLQGFSIDSVARSRNRIVFSGTAALVASAFGSPLHYYVTPATAGHPASKDFAPSADLTLPAALASSVQAIGNLSTFRLHPHIRPAPQATVQAAAVKPNFTSSQTGNHYLTPGDIATIYDIAPAYSAGFTGVNQSITVIGQSLISLADVAAFQSATGITAKTPQLILEPNTGAATTYSGDEGESDLDLEYTSTIAKGAQVFFVYTGDSSNYGVFDSLIYAVDERISPIISSSYGDCEADLGATYYAQFNATLQQAAAQGQTVVSAAGDDGSTDCYGISDTTITTVAEQEALAVDFPASSQYVTGLGGTEFLAADVASGNNTYFTAQGTSDVVSSALSYIPEQVWNDDLFLVQNGSTTPLSSGGGGVSIFTARPSWQSGTIGGVAIPSGNYRLIPDLSLDASSVFAPFAYCTSDTTYWSTGQVSSCTSGLRDTSTGALTIAGGTSFDAPIFSGMLALINQSQNSTGQGVINPILYTLAANATTYASAFHDITSGGNQCDAGTLYCSTAGAGSFAAAAGYDEASGLGSIDLYKLLTAWPSTATTSLVETVTTLVPVTALPAPSATDTISITVAENNLTNQAVIVPTGSVAIAIDSATSTVTVPLVNGVATYTFSSASLGAHVVTATYSGDTLNAPSTASLSLDVTAASVGSFTVAAGNITVASGATGTSTVTVTPAGGYTGTVVFSLTAPSAVETTACYSLDNVAITGTAAVTAVLTLDTKASDCATADSNATAHHRLQRFRNATVASSAPHPPAPNSPWRRLPVPAAMAGLLLFFGLGRGSVARGFIGRRSSARRNLLRAGLTLAILVTLSLGGLSLTACSSSATASQSVLTAGDTPAGTYTLTLTATDSVNSNQTATANFTLTVQ